MKKLAHLIALTLVCALGTSCKGDAEPITQVIVVVRSDLEIGTQLTQLRLDLLDPSGREESHTGQRIPLVPRDPREGEETLPLSFGIIPEGGDASLRFLLRVRGYGPLEDGGVEAEIVRESVLTGFLPGETTVIYVFLGSQCLRNLCEGQGTLMSCDYQSGMCADVDFDPPVPVDEPPSDGEVPVGCSPGFKARGGDCIDIDECEAESDEPPCGARASCANASGGYTCVCEDDSTVAHDEDCDLEEPPNEPGPCDDDPCQAPGECIVDGDDFTCSCPSGYDADGTTCTDIDECELGEDACDPRSTCVNERPGYRCADCPSGYSDPDAGDTECADIDECELDTDGCEAPTGCTNTDGSFQCEGCDDGFVDPAPGATACVDIDECMLDTDGCDAIATCRNTPGSFRCDCPDTDVDPAEGVTTCEPITDGCVIRVSTTGNDANDGSSWPLAKATIGAALGTDGVCEVWVAQGTYKPGNARSATFQLEPDVGLYGGFAGNEALRSQRDFLAHPTTLSGNIAAAGASDNTYHVVVGAAGATLSGFFVVLGYAHDAGVVDAPTNQGGGMYNAAITGGVTISQVVFASNQANFGGAVANHSGTVFEVDESVFLWNDCANAGGGITSSGSNEAPFTSGTITSSTFYANSGSYGVGVWAYSGELSVRDSTFQANVTDPTQSSGAFDLGILSTSATPRSVINTTFIGNTGAKGAALWIDGSAPDVVGCSFINNACTSTDPINMGSAVSTRQVSFPTAPHILNSLFWGNTLDGDPTDVSNQNGGSPFVDSSCALQDLDGFGAGNVNVTLEASPLAAILPSGIAYLDQAAAAPTCMNTASSVLAADASIPWSTLTTAANGALDMTEPDVGRHVSPAAVAITMISATATTLSWMSRNATSCAWIDNATSTAHAAATGAAATASASHGAATGTRLALICSGPEGEPAVASATVP